MNSYIIYSKDINKTKNDLKRTLDLKKIEYKEKKYSLELKDFIIEFLDIYRELKYYTNRLKQLGLVGPFYCEEDDISKLTRVLEEYKEIYSNNKFVDIDSIITENSQDLESNNKVIEKDLKKRYNNNRVDNKIIKSSTLIRRKRERKW